MKRQTSFIISIICILYIGGCGFREDEGMSEASGADIPEVDSAPATEVFGGYVTPSQYALEAEKPQSSSDVTLVMAGDILLHDRIEQVAKDSDGEVIIKDNSVRALVCHNHSEEHGVTVYPLSEYSEDLVNENEIRLNDSSFSRQYCIDLCNRIWGESWE